MDKEKKQLKKEESKPKAKGRLFKGVVVSDKMDKTITVLINRYKKHPKYKKRYKVSKKYKVHDEKNEHKKGEIVIIQECKPISKDKKWIVLNK